MTDSRNAYERLDALLTGLEDEVMRGEGVLATDVKAMRVGLEELIMKHARSGIRPNAARTAEGIKSKRVIAKELMGRLAGIGQRAVRSSPLPRVRMAFSSKRDSSEGRERAKSRSSSGSGKKRADKSGQSSKRSLKKDDG